MTGPSALDAAVEDLYSHPMAEFTSRRKTLAAAARKAGDRESAGRIAALRKPTLAADTLNQLVRSAPDEVGELFRLGAELRDAEKALDAHQLRELTGRRRSLVRDLADLAFDVTGQATPSASVREEVAGTLNAALADEQVAELLMSGVLITQAHWDGFGSTALPELAAVLSLDTLREARRVRAEPVPPAPAAPAGTAAPEPAPTSEARAAPAVAPRTGGAPNPERARTDHVKPSTQQPSGPPRGRPQPTERRPSRRPPTGPPLSGPPPQTGQQPRRQQPIGRVGWRLRSWRRPRRTPAPGPPTTPSGRSRAASRSWVDSWRRNANFSPNSRRPPDPRRSGGALPSSR